jgi:hypothetical protein
LMLLLLSLLLLLLLLLLVKRITLATEFKSRKSCLREVMRRINCRGSFPPWTCIGSCNLLQTNTSCSIANITTRLTLSSSPASAFGNVGKCRPSKDIMSALEHSAWHCDGARRWQWFHDWPSERRSGFIELCNPRDDGTTGLLKTSMFPRDHGTWTLVHNSGDRDSVHMSMMRFSFGTCHHYAKATRQIENTSSHTKGPGTFDHLWRFLDVGSQ